MHKGFLKTAFLLGALSVVLGAFAAHALKTMVTEKAIGTFETAVRYQFYHVFALAIVAIVYKDHPFKIMVWAGRLFIAGIILFSGSLYLLTFMQVGGNNNYQWIGAITPFGGLAFIGGWLLLFFSLTKKN